MYFLIPFLPLQVWPLKKQNTHGNTGGADQSTPPTEERTRHILRMLSVPVLAGAEHYRLRQVFWLVMSRTFSQPKAAMAFVPDGTAGNHPLGHNAKHTRHFTKDTQQRDCAGFPPASLLIALGTKAQAQTAVAAKLRILVRKNAAFPQENSTNHAAGVCALRKIVVILPRHINKQNHEHIIFPQLHANCRHCGVHCVPGAKQHKTSATRQVA